VLGLRGRPDQRELVLGSYYDDPLVGAARRYYGSEEWADVRPWLGVPAGLAVDVGAGRGIASYALAKEGFTVIALEPDPSDIVGGGAIRALAKETGANITVEQAGAEAIPLPDASCALVFARAALHHTRDLAAACREFHRILRPGGRLIALREHVISRPEDLQAFLDIHPLHRFYGGENAFELGVYKAAIEDAGLTLSEVRPPLASAMNYAPHTAKTLRAEIARRAGPGRPIAAAVLSAPGVWPALLPLLTRLDHRPGRLYSFLARKA